MTTQRTALAPGATIGPRGVGTAPLDSAFGRRFRAAALALLLTGSLLPSVGGVSVNGIAALVVAPLVGWEVLRRLPRTHPALVYTVMILTPLVASAAFNPPHTAYGTQKVTAFYTTTLISMLGVTLLRDERSIAAFAKAWVFVSLPLAAIALSGGAQVARATVFDSNPIWLARALATAAVAVVWMGWHRYISRWLWPPLVVVLILAVLQTGSRGPTLGAVVGIVAVSTFASRGRKRRLLTVVGAVALALPFLPAIPALRGNRVIEFLSVGEGAVDSVRAEMWRRTARLIAEEPVGVGFGNWQTQAPSPTAHAYPHNLFLEVVAEAGWLGGGLVVLLVAWAAISLTRTTVQRGAAPISSLVLGMTATEVVAVSVSGDLSARTFFATLALAWTASHLGRLARCVPSDAGQRHRT